jgi:hypothetical protein
MNNTIKELTIFSALWAALSFCNAQTYYIEDGPDYTTPPREVAQAVKSFSKNEWGNDFWENCDLYSTPVGLTANGDKVDHIVSTKGCGGGSSSMPVWLVAKIDGRYRVVLSSGAVAIDLKNEISHGLRNISATQGNAGHCERIEMEFNERLYTEVARKKCKK